MTEFANLGLSPTTLKAVADTGYTTATPIQEQAIPVALAGRDVLGIAQTGTGKTAAFTLPMVDRLAAGRARARMPRALVLAPTRELADQVAESFAKYAKGTRLNWVLLIGGVSMGDQVAMLTKGVDVLIATPGRLLDLFERGKILLTGVEMMVVDEADRMLDMGFIPDIERIFKLTPPRRQTLFFSATMPPEITRLTQQFLKDPTRVEVSRPAMTADTISQYVAPIGSSDPKAKREALRALIRRSDVKNGIVFCNRKSEVDIVAKSLKNHGFDAAPIHGDLDQSLRTKTLAAFRAGELKLLVASDVAARGLDIPDVSHVFNYDVPHHADDYVHRIGRTGRAGRSGEAFMIVTPADEKSYDKVLKLTKKTPETIRLEPAPAPARPERKRAERSPKADTPVAAAEVAAPRAEPEVVEPRPAPRPERTRNAGERGRRDRGGERTPAAPQGTLGFGDDIPAFLRRPVRA
ncbi:DEAD/DEAH box helicase [Brevundimonas balnearis]|uniref:DEAD/DEAH box helicase n=1 Tax=Brevundimonas balnearis TaxID=1572858 RepID=A0ABV6QZJ9_9CAUL